MGAPRFPFFLSSHLHKVSSQNKIRTKYDVILILTFKQATKASAFKVNIFRGFIVSSNQFVRQNEANFTTVVENHYI